MDEDITEKEIEAAQLFFQHAAGIQDITLLILKGHLVLEEIVRTIIKEKLPHPEALKDARLDCFQAICLAESLCSENHREIWPILKKLNKMRNDIAHNLDNKGINDKIDALNSAWPSGLNSENREQHLFMTIFSLVSILSSFLKEPKANVIQLFQ